MHGDYGPESEGGDVEVLEEARGIEGEPLARVVEMLDLDQDVLDRRQGALREQGYAEDEISQMCAEEATDLAREEVEEAARAMSDSGYGGSSVSRHSRNVLEAAGLAPEGGGESG